MEQTNPAGHGSHCCAWVRLFLVENVPTGHPVGLEAPVGQNEPSGQRLHDAESLWAVCGWYVPGGQGCFVALEAPAGQKNPGRQGMGVVVPADGQALPLGQTLQSARALLCVWPEKRPAGHSEGAEESASQKPPAGHGATVSLVVPEGQKDPAGHSYWHPVFIEEDPRRSPYFPGGHGRDTEIGPNDRVV